MGDHDSAGYNGARSTVANNIERVTAELARQQRPKHQTRPTGGAAGTQGGQPNYLGHRLDLPCPWVALKGTEMK